MNANFDCDVLVIGLGPAGMAVSAMSDALGLKVTAIEENKIGGECLNVGCIPSKALLKTAKMRQMTEHFEAMGLTAVGKPDASNPFQRVRSVVKQVNEGKTTKMFEKLDLVLGKGSARFIDSHTVEVEGVRKIRARKIFICTGTKPHIPHIKGIDSIPVLTNDNLFELNHVPKSMLVIGGGAIGSEMGQAISRLGAKVTILNAASCLLPRADSYAGELLCSEFKKEGIEVVNSSKIKEIISIEDGLRIILEGGKSYEAEKLLVAAGREINFDKLNLEAAGIKYSKKSGILVDDFLRTSRKHIYAVGDCNGYRQFTHAAMHQGMLALINAMSPTLFKKKYKNYVVPWSVFTEPEVSHTGFSENELREMGIKYEVVHMDYADYGRSTADGSEIGFIRALLSKWGRIYGVTIVGEGSSEMIQEFSLAIQEKKRLSSILFLQHSFPTYSFMNKRIAETWLMNKVNNNFVKRMAKKALRFF